MKDTSARQLKYLSSIVMLLTMLSSPVLAEDELLLDRTGDEVVSLAALGDSLTFGVGDGTLVGEYVDEAPRTDGNGGYPARVAALLNLPVYNFGVPGEQFSVGGVARVPYVISTSGGDIIGLFGGSNDAIFRVDNAAFEAALQKSINVTVAMGRTPLLFTLSPPCCNHHGPDLFTREYSTVVRRLALQNNVAVVDLERVWHSSCDNADACQLYNLPEGLHPNSAGYDAIAQAVAAVLLGIDLFSAEGATDLETALELEPGTVIVRPDVPETEE